MSSCHVPLGWGRELARMEPTSRHGPVSTPGPVPTAGLAALLAVWRPVEDPR